MKSKTELADIVTSHPPPPAVMGGAEAGAAGLCPHQLVGHPRMSKCFATSPPVLPPIPGG